MVNRIQGGFGGPGGGPPNPYSAPQTGGGQALPGGGPQVVLHYLGGRLGKFMVSPGGSSKEYFFCKSAPDALMTLVEARSIVNQSPSEFTVVAAAPPPSARSARRPGPSPLPQQSPIQQPMAQQFMPSVPAQAPATVGMSRFPFAAAKEGLKAHRPQCNFYPRFPDWTFVGLSEIQAAGFELCSKKCCFALELEQAKGASEADG